VRQRPWLESNFPCGRGKLRPRSAPSTVLPRWPAPARSIQRVSRAPAAASAGRRSGPSLAPGGGGQVGVAASTTSADGWRQLPIGPCARPRAAGCLFTPLSFCLALPLARMCAGLQADPLRAAPGQLRVRPASRAETSRPASNAACCIDTGSRLSLAGVALPGPWAGKPFVQRLRCRCRPLFGPSSALCPPGHPPARLEPALPITSHRNALGAEQHPALLFASHCIALSASALCSCCLSGVI